jgi:hypothetical protein
MITLRLEKEKVCVNMYQIVNYQIFLEKDYSSVLNDYLAFRKRNSVCQYVSNSKLPDIFGKRFFLRVKRLPCV